MSLAFAWSSTVSKEREFWWRLGFPRLLSRNCNTNVRFQAINCPGNDTALRESEKEFFATPVSKNDL